MVGIGMKGYGKIVEAREHALEEAGRSLLYTFQDIIREAQKGAKEEERKLKERGKFSEERWLYHKHMEEAYKLAIGILYDKVPHLAVLDKLTTRQVEQMRQIETYHHVPVSLAYYDSEGKPANVVVGGCSPADLTRYLSVK